MELNNNLENHDHATVSLKLILLVFTIILVGALGYFVWQSNTAPDTTNYSSPVTKTESQPAAVKDDPCDFAKVNPALKAAVNYDLGGGEEFDTVVCGYLSQKQEDMAFTGDAPLLKNRAYFNATAFKDTKFKDALDKQISEGNTVNSATAGTYQLGCGCYENDKISSDVGSLADLASQVKLLASTKDSPVIAKLSFYIEGGRGCTCCNLLDKIEVL